MLRIIFLSLILIICNNFGLSQSERADSLKQLLKSSDNLNERIALTHQLHGSIVNLNPDSALHYANQAFNLSEKSGDDALHTQSYFNLGHALFVNGQNEEFRSLLNEAVTYVKGTSEEYRTPGFYRNLAIYGEVTDQPDSSLYYIDKCIASLQEFPDSSTLGDAFLSKGFAYRVKGYYNLSIEALLDALRIFDEVGSPNQRGYAYLNIGIAYGLSTRYQKAIEYMESACAEFLKQDNIWACAQATNNIGLWYQDLDSIKQAATFLHQSLSYSKMTNQLPVMINNYWNLARMYMDGDQVDSARYYLDLALDKASETDDKFIISGVWRKKAIMEASGGERNLAVSYYSNSRQFPENYNNPTYILESKIDGAEFYELIGDFESSLTLYKESSKSGLISLEFYDFLLFPEDK